MQKSNLGLSNPIDMIFHVQPIMIVALLPFTLGFEGSTLTRGLANIQV
jgi:solute carrier family 35 protein C2